MNYVFVPGVHSIREQQTAKRSCNKVVKTVDKMGIDEMGSHRFDVRYSRKTFSSFTVACVYLCAIIPVRTVS